MQRWARLAVWLIPPIVYWYVYEAGLRAWFLQDDFAWLSLLPSVHSAGDLLAALFAPSRQGTFRPLGERAFFMGAQALFGLNSLPLRICAFATQLANLALLGAVMRRLTRSELAALAAPLLWIVNSKLAQTMTWSSAYIIVLCAFFLLLAFWCLVRHIESGEWRYYAGMWISFVLGFGAMETNVVFPGLAAAYTLLCARPYFRRTWPLFAASAAFLALRFLLAPAPSAGLYAPHLDAALPRTFGTYWIWAFEPVNLELFTRFPAWAGPLGAGVFTAAIVAFTALRTARGDRLPLFFLAWFAITLAPVLPLRDHLSDYYLTIPVMGLAMLGGWAAACAWRGRWPGRAVAAALILLFALEQVPVARGAARWWSGRSRAVRNVVRGVMAERARHPRAALLLADAGDDVFWGGIAYDCFSRLGIFGVYLAPDAEAHITAHPEIHEISPYVLDAGRAAAALAQGRALVYRVLNDGRLEDITAAWRPAGPAAPRMARALDFADPFAGQLGPSWYESEGGHRWMPRTAGFRIAGPRGSSERLYLAFNCPAHGPTQLTVSIDGRALPPAPLRPGQLTLSFALPPETIGQDEIGVTLALDRTLRAPPDPRDLGLAFGTAVIR